MLLINMQNVNLFSVFNVHLMQLSFLIVRLSQFITRLTSGVSSQNIVQRSGQIPSVLFRFLSDFSTLNSKIMHGKLLRCKLAMVKRFWPI